MSLTATLMASSFVVLRSSYAAWTVHEADLDRAANAAAVLRHIVRRVRQADGVSAIDAGGSLTVVDEDGVTHGWSHSGTDVSLSVNSGSSQPVAEDIQSLTFEGYLADGVTSTTDPDDVQSIRIVVTTQQPAGGTRTISSYAWVRSW